MKIPMWKRVVLAQQRPASESVSHSVVTNSVTPMDCIPQAPLSMELSRQYTGGGSHSLLQGIFSAQRSAPGLLHSRQILYSLSHREA